MQSIRVRPTIFGKKKKGHEQNMRVENKYRLQAEQDSGRTSH